MDRSEVLISTAELADRLDDPALAVIEVDEDTTAYARGHIPGAVALHWQDDLQAAPRRDFVDSKQLAGLLGARGVGDEREIVLYGGNSNWFAAYAYWLFRHRGIDGMRLLDGGRVAWEAEGRPLSDETPSPRTASRRVGQPAPELRILRDEVLDRVRAQTSGFVDVRSPAEFTGEVLAPPHLPQEQAQVPGHIPGAVNITWSKAVREDGTFRDDEELRSLYGDQGITPDREIVAYCRIGERSAHTWFVLHELLGYPDVRNYDGSWTEYGSLVDVPVAR